MQLSDEQVRLLNSIATEWNQAEEDVKVAEQICNDIVVPAIKELRYAGRRIVDSITKMHAGEDVTEIEALLREARFDCHRARHDAIDAATAKIAIDLQIMVKKLGVDVILPVYPQFPALFHQLQAIRVKIRNSRKDRTNRAAIYAVLETVDFVKFTDDYNEMRGSEDLMKQIAGRRRKERVFNYGVGGLGLVALIITITAWILPDLPKRVLQPAVANTPSTVAKPGAPVLRQ